MQLEVLVSCMNQTDYSIVQKSRLTGDVLIINQCLKDCKEQIHIGNQRIRMISTKQHGLSNSRNLAVHLSDRDICLLCDDDEIFVSDYERIIIDSFERLGDADIIAFNVENKVTRLKNQTQKIGRLQSLKLSSVQLAFRRSSIRLHNIQFDPLLGAGSGNGCGEENKFLLDCLKAGLHVYYVPQTIARLLHNDSTWFKAYDDNFFWQRGGSTRYIMGLPMSVIYGIYYILAKYPLYRNTITILNAAKALCSGIRDNVIGKTEG